MAKPTRLDSGIGIGGIALPLADRGIRVAAIELSQAMVDELDRTRPMRVGGR